MGHELMSAIWHENQPRTTSKSTLNLIHNRKSQELGGGLGLVGSI